MSSKARAGEDRGRASRLLVFSSMGPEGLWAFLVDHAYVAVFVGTIVDAIGVPFPGRLLLITAGGLAALGSADPALLIVLASTAAVTGDHLWYLVGRRGGDCLLRFYCRLLMLEATSCADRARSYLVRFGPAAFIVGRFVAGVRILLTPLAASSGMPYLRYLLCDSIGATVWVSLWILLGYFLGSRWLAWAEKPDVRALGAVVTGGAVLTVALTVALRWRHRTGPAPPVA
jgi:membrane protein DedA with SNARE-associated domain